MKYFLYFILFIFSSQNAFSHENYPPPNSLKKSIALALTLNAKTRSKDVQVESAHYQTLAARDQMLPSGSYNYSIVQQRAFGNPEVIGNYPNTTTRDSNISLSATLWDGGTNYYNYKAAQAQELALQSRFNSTNPLILYTKGSIANQTMQAYQRLVKAKVMNDRVQYDKDFYILLIKNR